MGRKELRVSRETVEVEGKLGRGGVGAEVEFGGRGSRETAKGDHLLEMSVDISITEVIDVTI